MPARSSMYFVCSAILSTLQTVPSNRVQMLISLSCTIVRFLSSISRWLLKNKGHIPIHLCHFQALHAVGSVGTMAFHDHIPGNCVYPVSSGISALTSCRAWLCRVAGRPLSRHLAHVLLILYQCGTFYNWCL